MKSIGQKIKTQDNRGTSHPMYLVQEKVRDYGYDPEYSDDYTWTNNEGDSPDRDEFDELEGAYRLDGDDHRGEWYRIHYNDRWEYVQTFFTQDAAEAFIRTQAHKYGELRTYVDSGYNNPEWRQIRDYLTSGDFQ